MPKPSLTLSSLIFATALCGCAANGPVVKPPPVCPAPPPVPTSLMQPPNVEQSLRRQLFESAPKPTPKSGHSRQS